MFCHPSFPGSISQQVANHNPTRPPPGRSSEPLRRPSAQAPISHKAMHASRSAFQTPPWEPSPLSPVGRRAFFRLALLGVTAPVSDMASRTPSDCHSRHRHLARCAAQSMTTCCPPDATIELAIIGQV
ncbi:hypothetical protein BC628DRAFT_1357375 [Trametes gibbosa]|nr:hypothetical protein BC628DRAFT_1357375 [Trametes gibbosa]